MSPHTPEHAEERDPYKGIDFEQVPRDITYALATSKNRAPRQEDEPQERPGIDYRVSAPTPLLRFRQHGGDLEGLKQERRFVQGDLNARALSLLSNEDRLAILREAGDDDVTAAENAKEIAAVFRPRPGIMQIIQGVTAIPALAAGPAGLALHPAIGGRVIEAGGDLLLGGGQALFQDRDIPSASEAIARGQTFPALARLGGQVAATAGLGAGAVAAKSAGTALKETVQAASGGGIRQTISNLSRDFLGVGDVKPFIEPDAAVAKLTQLVKEAKPVIAEQQALRTTELGERVGQALKSYRDPSLSPAEAFRTGAGALKGELPKADFTPTLRFTNEEAASLLNKVRLNQKAQFFESFNAHNALNNLIFNSQLPRPFEVELLEKFFGADLAKALLSKRALGEKLWENTLDAISLPRSLVATMDMSAPLRQGFVLGAGHPGEWLGAWKPMVRAFASEKYVRMVDDVLSTGARAALREEAGLYRAPVTSLRSSGIKWLSQREEAFVSRLASRIPGVRASERAYLTFLNKLRADVFDHTVDSFAESGKRMSADELKALARFVNHASGRGTIIHEGAAVRDLSVLLNATFFSPRFLASRVETPLALLPKTRLTPFGTPLRQLFNVRGPAKDLLAYTGMLSSLMGLAKLGGMQVETDPRSSDFGKIRSGNTRIDLMSGNQQLFRAIWQLVDKETKSPASGRIDAVTKKELGLRLLRSKLSPTAGTLADLWWGENMIGEVPGEKGIGSEFWNRLAPLAAQDLWEAIKDAGVVQGVVKAGPAFFGAGAVTFESVPSVRDAVAQERAGQRYIELDRGRQAEIDQDERVVAAKAKYARPPKPADADEATTFAVQRYTTLTTAAEAEFAKALEAGATGEALRKAVQRLGEAKADAGNALYDDPLIQGVLKGKNEPVLRDALGADYWGVPLDVDPETQTYRFEEQEAQREAVLKRADTAGIPREYITGTGANTYRAKRQFSSPVIKEAVEAYDTLRIQLKEVDWNDFAKKYPNLLTATEHKIYEPALVAYKDGGSGAFEEWLRGQKPELQSLFRTVFNKVKDRINDARTLYRSKNPEFDRLYVRFYDAVPMTQEGKRDVAQRLPTERRLEVLDSGLSRISSTHRDALTAAQLGTLDTLAGATPEQVSRAAGVNVALAQHWIAQAKAILAVRQ